ncbi:MAG: tetratricopeptide repeat protein [Planctomycetes bacterium]|nr:tetratricopeptide repeat protein [Planctomycetota bacterium]
MPGVVNGCGTWYYGKKNVQQYQGVCRACNRVTTLTSYDTRLFVVFLFIPVFPLGRKRIIEDCAACRRHHAMAFGDWERANRRTQEAVEAYRRSPTDPTLAEEAVGACLGIRSVPAFLDLAPEIEQQLASNAKTMCLLAAAYDLFGHIQDSERLLQTALQSQDDYDTRELLADCLLRQDRHHEAQPYLQHIVDEGIPDRVDLLYQLAQGYQTKGEHEKALAVFQQCEVVNPGIVEDAVFVRLRDASTDHLGTHVAVKPADVANQMKRGAAFRRFTKVAAVVLVLAAVAYGALAWIQGLRREVFLVNGLERAYSVRLNGKTHVLEPQSVTKLRPGEGDIEVAIVDAPPGIAPETVTIRTAFLTRPFAKRTFVLNPDRAAILRRSRIYYSSSTSTAAPPATHSFIGGQTLHQFSGVDHAFEEPPRSISTDSHAKRVSREGLYLLSANEQVAMPTMILGLLDSLGKDAASRIARQHLLMEPQRYEYLRVLGLTTEPEELVAFLRTGVAQHPLELQWHRAYQSAMEDSEKQQEVEREYETMLAKDRHNKNLMYLAGRVSPSIDKAVTLFRQSTEGDSPCPYSFYALCGYYLGIGQFREAAENAEKAIKLLPNEREIQWYHRQALLADGQQERLLAVLQAEQAAPAPWCLTAIEEEAYVRSILGEQAKVKEVIGRLERRLKELGLDPTSERIRRLEAELAYAAGNPAKSAKILLELPEPGDQLIAHLIDGDLAAAEKDLQQPRPDTHTHLLLYLTATSRNERDIAERHLQSAVDLLAKGTSEDQAFAGAIKGDSRMPIDELLRQHQIPQAKAILLTTAGLRNPAGREQCFTMARKLNYDKRFPHLLLMQVLASQPVN